MEGTWMIFGVHLKNGVDCRVSRLHGDIYVLLSLLSALLFR
jgi:hypothetical protein